MWLEHLSCLAGWWFGTFFHFSIYIIGIMFRCWLGGLEHFFIFPYIGNNNPNWWFWTCHVKAGIRWHTWLFFGAATVGPQVWDCIDSTVGNKGNTRQTCVGLWYMPFSHHLGYMAIFRHTQFSPPKHQKVCPQGAIGKCWGATSNKLNVYCELSLQRNGPGGAFLSDLSLVIWRFWRHRFHMGFCISSAPLRCAWFAALSSKSWCLSSRALSRNCCRQWLWWFHTCLGGS